MGREARRESIQHEPMIDLITELLAALLDAVVPRGKGQRIVGAVLLLVGVALMVFSLLVGYRVLAGEAEPAVALAGLALAALAGLCFWLRSGNQRRR
jgi:hypothetical protein